MAPIASSFDSCISGFPVIRTATPLVKSNTSQAPSTVSRRSKPSTLGVFWPAEFFLADAICTYDPLPKKSHNAVCGNAVKACEG
jgi:hypothetical protein